MELIIASILVGIVTMGLIAAEQAVRMSRQSSFRDNQVSAQLQAAMTMMTRDANLTVGDATNTGIYQYSDATRRTICFRQGAGNSNIYTDDVWACWSVDMADGNLTSRHGLNAFDTLTVRVASTIDWVRLTDLNFFSLIDTGNLVIAPSNAIAVGKVQQLEIHLQSSFNTTIPAHPIENPEYILETYISPAGLSR